MLLHVSDREDERSPIAYVTSEVLNSVHSLILHLGKCSVLFGLKFADNIHYKFKSSQASNAKHTGAKQNLTQNGHSRSFKVMCFGVSGNAIRE